MYVDKKLRDVAAVQTLSRLNRIVKAITKRLLFLILKTYEDINRALLPTTEKNFDETITPSDVFDLDAKIESYGIVDNDDVHAYNQFLYQEKRSSRDKTKMLALLSNVYARVQRFDEKEQVNIA